MRIGIVIPAFDEEEAVGQVVGRCKQAVASLGAARIVVCDNDSRDRTASVARQAGAEVVHARPRGYGTACLAAIAHLGSWPDILIFLDADGSSRPEEMERLLEPVLTNQADLVIGVRPRNASMTPPQLWGNRLATQLVARHWGRSFADLGPFRAIRRVSYERLAMSDPTWGWTIEMQILAVLCGLRVQEVSVSWDRRLAGVSKISGTVCGVIRAGTRILWTIARYAVIVRSPESGFRSLKSRFWSKV
jgi:glycosyltransferase involved in cell wall biosynthesis